MTEELQIVVEALNSMGGDAKQAFIAWMVVHYLSSFILSAAGAGLALAALRYIYRLLSHCSLTNRLNIEAGRGWEVSNKQRELIMATFKRGLQLEKELE